MTVSGLKHFKASEACISVEASISTVKETITYHVKNVAYLITRGGGRFCIYDIKIRRVENLRYLCHIISLLVVNLLPYMMGIVRRTIKIVNSVL